MTDRKITLHPVDESLSSKIARNTVDFAEQKKAENGLLEIGAEMLDGTVYVGLSPDTGKPMYVMPEDARWMGSPEMSFSGAEKYAFKLNVENAHGRRDWRLPTERELNYLYENRNKGALKGTFNEASAHWSAYWSSTLVNGEADDPVCVQSFEKGKRGAAPKHMEMLVRYVRS